MVRDCLIQKANNCGGFNFAKFVVRISQSLNISEPGYMEYKNKS